LPEVERIRQSTSIRLIDFDLTTFQSEYHQRVITTRHYRAPEIILGPYSTIISVYRKNCLYVFVIGLGWSYPCDAFSLGCILVECFTGKALFQTHDNLEHLAMMEILLGKMPDHFALVGARSKPEFFKEDGSLDWPKPGTPDGDLERVKATLPLQVAHIHFIVNALRADGNLKSQQEIISPKDEINEQFLTLVQGLLNFDPVHRITVKEALEQPYFLLHISR
jgi:dual-specificity kinase